MMRDGGGRRRVGPYGAGFVGTVDVAPAGSVRDVPAALTGPIPRPTYRIVLMRACDLCVGDVVRRAEVEEGPYPRETRWRTVTEYHDPIVGPHAAVWTCDLASDDLTLWEVQVRD